MAERLDLSDDEREVLQLLRTGNFDAITIRQKGGEIERIEAHETIDNAKRIEEILTDGNYQDIEIKQADGKVVSIKRTLKKKLR